ncbi:astacin-like metalloendopeptidase [Lutra lutra]|uniref:astacin-like metalloendopeptidase n=1 Tax=Lutra lutra TaxID=9657 RepID=UPI001FD39BB9|nr:astacin-like metalloendopeptidase [Lutra lutra]
MGGLWPWVLGLLSLPGLILGAPSACTSPEACGTSFSEGLNPEETQVSQDKDIPAINQGLIPEESPESSFLLEGDILRPSPFQVFSASSNKWPKNGGVVEVPFLLSSKYDKASREVLLRAFAEFERFTCIRFVAYRGQRDFISIIPMSGCFSSVGRSGGMQVVSLAPTCLQKGPGIVLHELMHVLGFWHEHSRADRDHYIRIDWNEILPGFEINFIKSQSSNMLVPYDYSSVLHYGRFAFSRRGLPTITPLRAPSVQIGQRWNLSTSDITRVLRLYDCNPSGQGPSGGGFQPHSDGRSPTPAPRPSLQRLLKALLAESGNPNASGPKAGVRHVAAEPRESSHSWELPAQRKVAMGASARLPQTPASSLNFRPGAGVPGVLERSQMAQTPSVPPTTSPEAGQLVPIQDALGNPDLPEAGTLASTGDREGMCAVIHQPLYFSGCDRALGTSVPAEYGEDYRHAGGSRGRSQPGHALCRPDGVWSRKRFGKGLRTVSPFPPTPSTRLPSRAPGSFPESRRPQMTVSRTSRGSEAGKKTGRIARAEARGAGRLRPARLLARASERNPRLGLCAASHHRWRDPPAGPPAPRPSVGPAASEREGATFPRSRGGAGTATGQLGKLLRG